MLIRSVALHTESAARCAQFYGGVLGLGVEHADGVVTVAAGPSRIEFREEPRLHDARHHIAFNIPSNLLISAKRWLAARTALIPNDGGVVVEFPSWNAHALYFLDPDGNVLEFIARHGLPPAGEKEFGTHLIQNVSEAGIAVPDVETAIGRLQEAFALPVYAGGGADFAALGDPEGLLIVVKSGRPWHPTTDAIAGPVPTRIDLVAPTPGRLHLAGTHCEIEAVARARIVN